MSFLSKIEKFHSNVCFVKEDRKKIFYKEVIEQSALLSKNLESRNLIIVLAQNHLEFLIGYISFLRKGLVQMLIDPKISTNSLKEIIKDYKPNYILLPNSRAGELNYRTLYQLEDHKILGINNDNNYSLNKDLCLLLSTSGSTGSKKFVKISYENIFENTKSITKFLKINKNHITITTMPPFYTYGLSILNTHLYNGAATIVTNFRIVEKKFWDLFTKEKVTSFGGVPYFFEILKKINFNKMNFPYLKYFTQAGGGMNKDLIKYFLNYSEKNKIKFIVMYGQTEATARMTYLPYQKAKKKIGSIGIPIPGGKISLKNEDNSYGNEGEIIYKGKNVSMGYSKNRNDLNKSDENFGVLSTGDIAKKDKEGYLYIIGRKSRDVKLFGHRVNLDELEKLLSKNGYDCLCLGLDNNVTVFYTNKDYDEKILALLAKETKIYKSCFKLKFIKEFPLNENGKIFYKKLEKIL